MASMLSACSQYNYNREFDRLESFKSAENLFLKAKQKLFAIQGFYFASKPDKVRCQFCELTLEKWCENDDPLEDHIRYSPNCSMLKRRAANIPIDPAKVDEVLPPVTYDECSYSSSSGSDKYSHPEFALPGNRFKTFDIWPLSLKQKPQDLVEAGFFYTGMADRVICFDCGVGLGQWEAGDKVWQEHAKHSPNCEFLKLYFGESSMVEDESQKGANSDIQTSIGQEVSKEKEPTQNQCAVCLENPAQVALVSCGHLLCHRCSYIVDKCPYCRNGIEKRLRIYF